MRKPFERLVEEIAGLSESEQEMTMGALAARLEVSVDRLRDAMDAIKMLRGERTYI